MRILGIETSCDETAVALIDASGEGADFRFELLGNGLVSQAALHAQYGGVFPNLAKREHARNLVPMLEQALRESLQLTAVSAQESAESRKLKAEILSQILQREPELLEQLLIFLTTYKKPPVDAIAVTYGPGLEPALWVGVNFAKALSLAWDVPIVAVNHMAGHIIISALGENESSNSQMSGINVKYPMLALLISGGHTELVLSREWMQYEIIGETRDDAVGEAFDKVARLMDLPYPGGPEISRLAEEARHRGDVSMIKLTRPMMDGYDFSFSGLKTAVRRLVEQNSPLTDEMKQQIAREFEDCVTDVLVTKTLRAIEEFGIASVVVGGGVSANTHIRRELAARLEDTGAQLLIPPPALATDNALMIALAGYFHALKKEFADPATLVAKGNLRLGN